MFLSNAFLLVGLSVVSSSALSVTKQYSLDTKKSVVKWVGSKVVGKHNGTVQLTSGTVVLDGHKPTEGQFTLNMTTITDLDIKSAEYKKKLEDHLKSDDFFNVKSHPTGTFKITSATKDKINDRNFTIVGELTIKGITKPVTFPAKIDVQGKDARATAKVTINRLDWDIRYNSRKFFDAKKLGDKIINDEIELELDLVATEALSSMKKS